MGLDVDNLTNSAYVIYIVVGYFLKYYILFYIAYVMIFMLMETYKYMCSAFVKIAGFFKILTNPPKLNIFGLKFTNYFSIIDAFLSLLIGILYFIIAVAFILITAVVSVPFNFLIAFQI
jgi:hypothetical protein